MDSKYYKGILGGTMTLERKVKDLSDALRSSGKSDPAGYYENLLDRIMKPSNEADKEEALQQMFSSGKLPDLANFNSEENRLFLIVHEEAKKMLEFLGHP